MSNRKTIYKWFVFHGACEMTPGIPRPGRTVTGQSVVQLGATCDILWYLVIFRVLWFWNFGPATVYVCWMKNCLGLDLWWSLVIHGISLGTWSDGCWKHLGPIVWWLAKTLVHHIVTTLWWTNILPWKITLFLMGKSTMSMAIFHCYVSSPEGIPFNQPP